MWTNRVLIVYCLGGIRVPLNRVVIRLCKG